MLGVFGPGRLKWLHFPLFFVLGWIGGVCVVPKMITSNMTLLYWILAGGVAYTIGMIPFCIKKSNCAHFIWHFFVLFGCICQWIGIYSYLY
jgi:hemolysin III